MNTRPADIDLASRAIFELLAQRGPEKTICPSEAARALAAGSDFRPFMPVVREAAQVMAEQCEIEVVQRSRVVDLDSARGPVRLRQKRPGSEDGS